MKNFVKYKALFKWIHKLSEKDQEWALKYLSDKGLKLGIESPIISMPVPDTAENRELNIKLKNAFRQRKIRERRTGKKAYSIVLSNTAIKDLNKISNRMARSRTDTLEFLITKEKELTSRENEIKKQGNIREELEANIQINNLLKKELSFALTRLAIHQLHEQSPASQHVPLAEKKDDIEVKFKELLEESKKNMKPFEPAISLYHTLFDSAWSKLINLQPESNPQNNTNNDSNTPSGEADYIYFFNLDDQP
ncbi:hypothetical protein SAMN05216578_10840 [Halopseudomonas formosensis]|uniref:Uncharacterized protein n=1 Tax=Halopseudomonas formosensis TaxID=1002526 RepID=A0A1I6BXZ4_9GAMM|nr:hypothetical protein [Halopseudomonas formosensis]SFQ85806.1 hypothetical protein SAMN05216578_10840 [Halopseudomonas formosensis]